MEFDFEIFNTVLLSCHGIVGGEILDRWWETVNLRIVLRSVIGRLRLCICFCIHWMSFPDCIILILCLKKCIFEKTNHAGIFVKVKWFSKTIYEFLLGVSSCIFNIFRQRNTVWCRRSSTWLKVTFTADICTSTFSRHLPLVPWLWNMCFEIVCKLK